MQTKTLTQVVGGLVGALVLTVGLLSVTQLAGAAQDPNQAPPADGRMGGRGRGGPGGPGGPGGRGGRMGGPLGPGIDIRDLTDAQREQVRAIRERHADELRPLVERVQSTRQALADAVQSNGDLRGLSIDLGTAEGELAFANAQIQVEVLNVLTPEQRQQMQERRKEMEARRANRPSR
jgi:protein CpxP